ncbi:E3 ubiquitin-protein ligase RNF144A-like [Vigna radiata var. radiata]|uniref:RBR-type E3 ubiquitin transferase n=1 Tax=Vigna radiata var. radiata TaxID=3916 RepID=A0A3Q0EL24_VIGRR|nr:E3 ubiquitin-protein ligase RNF144A-like [Vigna radiata var. radiata]
MLSGRVKKKAVQVDVNDIGDLPLRKLKRKHEEIDETSLAHCGICMDAKPGKEMFRNQNCSHLYCDYCIGQHVAAKIQENISMVKCPEPKCNAAIEPDNCRSIIPKEVFGRWENALSENVVLGSQKFYCPFKDCSAMMICEAGEVVTSSECPHCNRLFCAQCKVSWHAGIDCEKFQRSKREKGDNGDSLVIELAKTKRWRRCSKCKIYVEKIAGYVAITFAMFVDRLGLPNIIHV